MCFGTLEANHLFPNIRVFSQKSKKLLLRPFPFFFESLRRNFKITRLFSVAFLSDHNFQVCLQISGRREKIWISPNGREKMKNRPKRFQLKTFFDRWCWSSSQNVFTRKCRKFASRVVPTRVSQLLSCHLKAKCLHSCQSDWQNGSEIIFKWQEWLVWLFYWCPELERFSYCTHKHVGS